MILQANGGHYLTESDEALSAAAARHFVKTVYLTKPGDIARWREVTGKPSGKPCSPRPACPSPRPPT